MLLIAAGLMAGGCSSDVEVLDAAPAPDLAATSSALPEREGPREETTGGVPHQQLDPGTVAEVDAELRRRAFLIPGVEEAPSGISLPGARALWLGDDLDIVQAGVLAEREFAHIHPDGSLHVWLPVERAAEVHETKWGELHPWVERDGFWDGVVMVYTPESFEELDIVMELVVDAYNFVTGSNVDAGAIF